MDTKTTASSRYRARAVAAAATATLALGLAACGGGDETGASTDASGDAAASLTASDFIAQLEDDRHAQRAEMDSTVREMGFPSPNALAAADPSVLSRRGWDAFAHNLRARLGASRSCPPHHRTRRSRPASRTRAPRLSPHPRRSPAP